MIGGGDWAEDRILPDAARAARAGAPLVVRDPAATDAFEPNTAIVRSMMDRGIALWTGEEQGLYGSKAYVDQHFGSFEDVPSSAESSANTAAPDKQEEATQTVLEQAKLLCAEWAA